MCTVRKVSSYRSLKTWFTVAWVNRGLFFSYCKKSGGRLSMQRATAQSYQHGLRWSLHSAIPMIWLLSSWLHDGCHTSRVASLFWAGFWLFVWKETPSLTDLCLHLINQKCATSPSSDQSLAKGPEIIMTSLGTRQDFFPGTYLSWCQGISAHCLNILGLSFQEEEGNGC